MELWTLGLILNMHQIVTKGLFKLLAEDLKVAREKPGRYTPPKRKKKK